MTKPQVQESESARLRAALERTEANHRVSYERWMRQLDATSAERDRYREALEQIAGLRTGVEWGDAGLGTLQDVAREALDA